MRVSGGTAPEAFVVQVHLNGYRIGVGASFSRSFVEEAAASDADPEWSYYYHAIVALAYGHHHTNTAGSFRTLISKRTF